MSDEMGPVHFQVLATTLLLVAPHVERDGERECNMLKSKLGFELRRLATQIYANYPVFADLNDNNYARTRATELANAATLLFGNMMRIADYGRREVPKILRIDEYMDNEQVYELGAKYERIGAGRKLLPTEIKACEDAIAYSPPEYRTLYEDLDEDEITTPPPRQQSPRSPSPQPIDAGLSCSGATWGALLFEDTSK